jgi:hypothetical protein
MASRRLTRRQLALGLLGLGVSGVIGGHGGAAAPLPQLAGARLTELASYSGWRTTWDLIVPLVTDASFPRTFLLYDRGAGQAAPLAVDQTGVVRQLQTLSGWRRSWSVIVSSGFPRVPGVRGLIAYDKSAGLLRTLQIDGGGTVRELASYPWWRKSWTAFAPFGTDGLVVYDRGAGYTTFFTIDTSGVPSELHSYNDWRTSWDILTSGPFVSGTLPPRDLLLYDRSARQAAGLTVGTGGAISQFANFSGWRQTWTSINGGIFRLRGYSGIAAADLVLFDQSAQEIEFLDIGPNSTLNSLLLTPTPGFNRWTIVTPLGPDLLLLYDRTTGTAGFYATDRPPLPVPTPTPTPRPTVTPTPAIVPTDRLNVRLEQNKGANNWDTYEGKSSDPANRGSSAVVSGVKNTTDKRISLIHWDRTGKRTGPVFIKAGEVSTAFNGMGVAGDWQAMVTGSESEAPPRVTLEVRYQSR